MSGTALEAELAALGLAGRVEERGPLAVVTVHDARAAADPAVRAAAVALAAAHGFASLALELHDDAGDRAPLSRD